MKKTVWFWGRTGLLTSLFALFTQVLQVHGQASFWTEVTESQLQGQGKRYIQPSKARYFRLEFEALKTFLRQAPAERAAPITSYGMPVDLPIPAGNPIRFSVVSYAGMEPLLAGKFPDIRTFMGNAGTSQVFMDFTHQGFHAQILGPEGSFYIDPVFHNETLYYQVYDRKDARRASPVPFSCGVSDKEFEAASEAKSGGSGQPEVQFLSGSTRRTYRLAVAATREYTAFHGGTVPLGLSAITTTMNRVNGIYNRDVTIRFTLVANNNLVVYTAEPDPYTNGDVVAMNAQNQSNLNSVIGNGNYDIGHVVASGGGGLVQGRVCNNDNKAYGSTGTGAPIGDPFDVDYVAHEIGHQCNAPHTWNGSEGSCAPGQWSSSTAVEPGSGITIMAYAGICGSQDLAPNSIDHFNNSSQNSIITFAQTGSGNSCGTTNATGNNQPTATVVSPTGKTIPFSTPYQLTGTGTDADNDALTYCWEQADIGPAGPPNNAARTDGPITRSFSPSTSNIRTVPEMVNILNGTTQAGNLLGTASRTMNFKFTVRDNRANGGGTRDASYAFNVTNTAGPFVLSSPNGNQTYSKSSPILVTWNVANTTAAPVSCSQVAIKLSVDGGLTYPYTLSSATANDGSELVNFPDVNSTTARVKIEAVGNIFFDVSNANFSIQNYCSSTAICNDIDFGNHFISQVQLNTLNVTSGCSANGYSNNISQTTTLLSGTTYPLQVRLGTNVTNNGVGAWIDYNNDGDFDDFGEFILGFGPGSGLRSGNITIPGSSAFQGSRRLRIRSGFNQTFTAGQACLALGFGETEDYTITIGGYCNQQTICSDIDFGDHFISQVTLSNLSNSSSCSPSGYGNFTLTVDPANVEAGLTYPLAITKSNSFSEGIGVWIDYNDDGDFNDAGEFAFQGLPNTDATVVANIRIQGLPSFFGTRRMRIRTGFEKTFSSGEACSGTGFGETEDYLINITGACWASAICSDIDFGNHFIQNFNFPGIQNTGSGCGNSGYTYYPSTQFLGVLGVGQTHSGSLLVSAGFDHGNSIWIDYNNDNDFNDAGEQIAFTTTSSTANNSWAFSFTVPNTTGLLGLHRMRVRTGFNTVFSPTGACTSIGFGETEDYFVDIRLGVQLGNIFQDQCTGTNLSVAYATTGLFQAGNIFSIQLSSKSGSFASPLTIGSGNTSPINCFLPDTLSASSSYRIRIVSSAPSGYSATSPSFKVHPSPKVFSMNPTSGPPGTLVTFTGSLLGVQTLFFGQTPTIPVFISPAGTTMQAVVPEGANTSPVYISTEFCAVEAPLFTVTGCTLSLLSSATIPATSPGCQDGEVQGFTNGPGVGYLYNTGTPSPVLFGIDTVDEQFTVRFPGLAAGNYQLLVQNSQGCLDTILVSLGADPCSLDLDSISTKPSGLTPGEIQFKVKGATCGGLIHLLKKWNGESFAPISTNPTQTGPMRFKYNFLLTGSYRILVFSEAGDCKDSANVVIDTLFSFVEKPVILPGTGVYDLPQQVQISCATPGAQIYYTTSGNTPVIGTSFTRLYNGPFSVLQTTTIRAMAVLSGAPNSTVTVAVLTITNPGKVQKPVASPGTGTYTSAQSVALSTSTSGAQLYYTTNGNTPNLTVPNTFTKLYAGPVSITSTTTLKVVGVKSGLLNSDVVTFVLTITNPTLPAATPVINPGTGNYAGPQLVTISSATPGASVYYTTNGNLPLLTTPNFFTKLYTGPFSVSSTTTIRAVATASGFTNSGVAVAVLTFAPIREGVDVPELTNSMVRVWPNPGTGLFYLDSGEEPIEQLDVVSVSGKLVFSQMGGNTEGSIPLDLRDQPAGLYVVRVLTSKGLQQFRISKI